MRGKQGRKLPRDLKERQLDRQNLEEMSQARPAYLESGFIPLARKR
jgi:hypothetical protein